MIMVSYCANKGWVIKNIEKENYDYREWQVGINIHHENEKVHEEINDFVNYKSQLISDNEEDCENMNFDIQQDLVDAGNKYLSKYEKKKQRIKRRKQNKKHQVEKLLSEMESLVHLLNSDEAITQIHWLDLNIVE